MKNAEPSATGGGNHPAPAPTEAERTTFDWPRLTGTTEAVLQQMEIEVLAVRRRRRSRRQLAAAAALTVLLAAGWGLRSHWWRQSVPAVPSLALLAQPERQVLPDGSIVLLRSGAKIAVDFSPTQRRVLLHTGEAHFEVMKNPERPFVVQAGGLDVRAVGTAFAVNFKQTAVEVLVTHGEVAVEKTHPSAAAAAANPVPAQSTSGEDASATLARLRAGSRFVADEAMLQTGSPQVTPVSDAELSERLAWRIPMLQFSRTPLADAIGLVNQYSSVRISIEDESLRTVKLSGIIRADNLDALVQLLEADHAVVAERRGENELVLRKRS
jgi:transmembrane sensor